MQVKQTGGITGLRQEGSSPVHSLPVHSLWCLPPATEATVMLLMTPPPGPFSTYILPVLTTQTPLFLQMSEAFTDGWGYFSRVTQLLWAVVESWPSLSCPRTCPLSIFGLLPFSSTSLCICSLPFAILSPFMTFPMFFSLSLMLHWFYVISKLESSCMK